MGVTNIQWADYTFNPWLGCRKVAPECEQCYITSTPPFRFRGLTHGKERIRTAASTWKQPLAWNRAAEREGKRARVFCLSLGDWLDDEVPIEWLADLLALIKRCDHLDWLLLTKRPQNFFGIERLGYTPGRIELIQECTRENLPLHEWINLWANGHPPSNVWIGVSAGADQRAALDIPARIHFLSCEPMLRALDTTNAARFDWIIVGGESGKKARKTDLRWLRRAVAFCWIHDIPCFVKQVGANIVCPNDTGFDGDPGDWPMDTRYREVDSGYQGAPVRVLLKDSHGGDMSEWPSDLRVREFPK